MRKNAPRKWLHAVLDLLPVIMIPVFMIYSHRHDIDTYTLNVAENKVVDFNQWVQEPTFEQKGNWTTYALTNVSYNGYCQVTLTNDTAELYANDINFPVGHKVLAKFITQDFTSDINIHVRNPFYSSYITVGSSKTTSYAMGTVTNSTYGEKYNLQFNGTSGTTGKFIAVNYYDLTQMFGAGNEPTVEQFSSWYTNESYDYTLSHKELLKGYQTVTYNDTDIMSQFTYNMYNSVNKYFNMNNVFGMTGIYDWFNLNIFNGNAPVYVYIVWNIILYEFIMDLLFLLYALFMFFIDFCTSLIERCYVSGKGGK